MSAAFVWALLKLTDRHQPDGLAPDRSTETRPGGTGGLEPDQKESAVAARFEPDKGIVREAFQESRAPESKPNGDSELVSKAEAVRFLQEVERSLIDFGFQFEYFPSVTKAQAREIESALESYRDREQSLNLIVLPLIQSLVDERIKTGQAEVYIMSPENEEAYRKASKLRPKDPDRISIRSEKNDVGQTVNTIVRIKPGDNAEIDGNTSDISALRLEKFEHFFNRFREAIKGR